LVHVETQDGTFEGSIIAADVNGRIDIDMKEMAVKAFRMAMVSRFVRVWRAAKEWLGGGEGFWWLTIDKLKVSCQRNKRRGPLSDAAAALRHEYYYLSDKGELTKVLTKSDDVYLSKRLGNYRSKHCWNKSFDKATYIDM